MKGNDGCRALQLLVEKERKGNVIEFNIFYFILFYIFANSRPNAQLQHIFFVQNVAEKKQEWKNVTTAKERAVYRRGTTEGSAIQMLHFFFTFLYLEDRNKLL